MTWEMLGQILGVGSFFFMALCPLFAVWWLDALWRKRWARREDAS